jgi:hypothetical protein
MIQLLASGQQSKQRIIDSIKRDLYRETDSISEAYQDGKDHAGYGQFPQPNEGQQSSLEGKKRIFQPGERRGQ